MLINTSNQKHGVAISRMRRFVQENLELPLVVFSVRSLGGLSSERCQMGRQSGIKGRGLGGDIKWTLLECSCHLKQ
jgi:hypothetical protein